MNALQRWCFALRSIRTHAAQMSARVDVENTLLDVAAGKRPMLSREECRAMAMKLGVPAHWNRRRT